MDEQIKKWKEQYEAIFKIILEDKEKEFSYLFIFRTIGRDEYIDLIARYPNEFDFQEKLCEKAVLYPTDYNFSEGRAGIPETLALHILDCSGFLPNQPQELLNQHRQEMNLPHYMVDCIIHEAFPEFTLEEIRSWSNRKTIYYLSRAEFILRNFRGINLIPLDEVSAQQAGASPNAEEYQYHFQAQPHAPNPSIQPQSNPTTSQPNQIPTQPPQTEEEVLRMLAENEAKHGRNISQPITNMNEEVFPELAWFKHEDELTGDW